MKYIRKQLDVLTAWKYTADHTEIPGWVLKYCNFFEPGKFGARTITGQAVEVAEGDYVVGVQEFTNSPIQGVAVIDGKNFEGMYQPLTGVEDGTEKQPLAVVVTRAKGDA